MRAHRLGELALGHTINKVLDRSFNYGLYPLTIWTLGPLVGGVIMSFALLVVCILCIRLYDWSKRDWLGIEAPSWTWYNGQVVQHLAQILPAIGMAERSR